MAGKFYPNDTPFQKLDCEAAFQNLSKQEKRYVHFISRASWEGHLIAFVQSSPESPLIFVLMDKIIRVRPTIDETKAHLMSGHAFSEQDVTALLVYAGAFFSNGGNYRDFGDSKFLPDLTVDKVRSVAKEVLGDEYDYFDKHCIVPMFDYEQNVRSIGFSPNGVTTFFSANCNETDGEIITKFLSHKKVEAWNQRAFKKEANTISGDDKDSYELRLASQLGTNDPDTTPEKLINVTEEFNGKKFTFTRGDYSTILAGVVENLKKAGESALNENEQNMMKGYVKYFETGSLAAHKDGSRFWIKDKGPVVESYIGFIENYRDPAGCRASFEGFVAVVNKEASKKLGVLVDRAEEILKSHMPWPKSFEKDSYLRPDFTALDIVSFSGGGVPSGINIPNYNEIRQNEGFKNVHLSNVILANYAASKVKYVSEADAELVKKYRIPSFEVQVGLHELLGHGSGKLFQQEEDGSLNFDKNTTIDPLTGKPPSKWYKAGETWGSLFATIASSYEECRAECVGIYLSTFKDVVKVFGYEGQEAEDVIYINWLSMVLAGLSGLETYNADIMKWGQAHSQARFVILRVLLKEAKGLADIKIVTNKDDGKPDLSVTLNRDEILRSGKKAIGDFLVKLQVYKSTADVEAAKKMFLEYSEVSEKSPSGENFLKIREIVLDRKKPRTIVVQSNTVLKDGDVELISYESTPEGFIKSWIDCYPQPDSKYKALTELYKKDLEYFPVK